MVESEYEPEQPESWAIGATVIHGKRKHQFYFENFEIATIAALQDGIRERVGVAVKRQRLLVRGVFVGEGTRSGCNAPTLLADLLPSSRQKKAKGLMVKVRLMHDAKYHDAQRAMNTLSGSISERLTELEHIVGSMHRKVLHNFFDEAQLIVNGRSYREEIEALAKSVDLLNSRSSGGTHGSNELSVQGDGSEAADEDDAVTGDAMTRIEALFQMSDAIEGKDGSYATS